MVHKVVYADPRNFKGRLAILTIREHLCGFYETLTKCVDAGTRVDSQSGHTVCLGCSRIMVNSGLRRCDICDRQYIDKNRYQDEKYETICQRCEEEYEL